ncbi:hypothetical protein [Pedococcus sp. 5OH_020]|nr:hypothetical protein [Pedococcus sp. 5OH_020]
MTQAPWQQIPEGWPVLHPQMRASARTVAAALLGEREGAVAA